MSKPLDGWISVLWLLKKPRKPRNATFSQSCAKEKKKQHPISSRDYDCSHVLFGGLWSFQSSAGAKGSSARAPKRRQRRKKGENGQFHSYTVLGCSLIRKWPIFLSCFCSTTGSRSGRLWQVREESGSCRDFLLVIRKSWTFATTEYSQNRASTRACHTQAKLSFWPLKWGFGILKKVGKSTQKYTYRIWFL